MQHSLEKLENLRRTRTIKLDEGQVEDKRQEILAYFNSTFALYEELFKVIKFNRSFYVKAEPLRHPLVFYFGHTATFFINKLMLAGVIQERVNPKFESMFAVGVDEMDWDDLNESHYDWPEIDELIKYRNQVQAVVEKVITNLPFSMPIDWSSPFWVIMMCIEHERIHLETSAVIIRRLPAEDIRCHPLFPINTETIYTGYANGLPRVDEEFPKNELLEVAVGEVRLGKKKSQLYGWDNEYGHHETLVSAFKASKFLVSNYEYLEFMKEDGYEKQEYWTEEGWRWNRSIKPKKPLFWVVDVDSNNLTTFKFRTLTKIIDMPWDWPVETNYLEAKAFCNWKAKKTGKDIRLPTEEEWYRLRDMIPEDQDTWEFGAVGNINLEVHASSCPVNKYKHNGFYDIIGNVWQHTETPIDGFPGFKIYPLYDDFSTPTFDTMHNIIKGGSWISTGNEATYHARYAFRRHFYQFAGFRYVESSTPVVIKNQAYETEPQATQLMEFHYSNTKHLNIENFQKVCVEKCIKACQEFDIPLNRAIDLGCGVGRSTFELAKGGFQEAVGLDLSARFFQLAVKLKDQGKVRYSLPIEGDIVEYKEVELARLGYEEMKDRVYFYQQDVSNLDWKKFNSFDLVFAGNLICQMKYPKRLIENVQNLLKPGGLLVVATTCNWNAQIASRDQWIGGYKKDGENYSTHQGLKDMLKDNFKEVKTPDDIEFVMRETVREFKYGISTMFYFQKLKN